MPVPQVTQAVRVDVEYAPLGHEVHIEAPEEAAYVPATQATQLDEVDSPAVDTYNPAAHASQLAAPCID